jgi:glyoxylase I family protein
MKLRLHHVNVVSDNMEGLHEFYSGVLGLGTAPTPPMIEHIGHNVDTLPSEDLTSEVALDNGQSWDANVGFFDASGQDELQIHASRRQAYLGPRMGHAVNPLLTGHFAFRTDDLNEVRSRLNAAGIPFSDYGVWSIEGWDQIFLTDPAGNVIEIHEILS